MATDRFCLPSFFSPSKSRPSSVPGFILREDAFTTEEEAALIHAVDTSSAQWTRRRTRITKNYGPYYFYHERNTSEGRFRYTDGKIMHTPLPDFLETLVMPILTREVPQLSDFKPNQLHVALYKKEEDGKIHMHNDNKMGELGPYIVGMCLLSDCHMTFMRPKDGRKRVLHLPRRCVYVMTGESHFEWRHGILKGQTSSDRVSFTLREVGKLAVEDGARVTKSSHIPSAQSIRDQAAKDRKVHRRETEQLDINLADCLDA
ncbi:2OG-Fe(II) oxygenase [Gracilaria domingensis]|nr:2OG-Fe(II) oxygenase [Gracilaria domingensis]